MIIDVYSSQGGFTSSTTALDTSVTTGSDDTAIVRSYAGDGTGDVVYVARNGKKYYVTCSTTLPPGTRWAKDVKIGGYSATLYVSTAPKTKAELEWEEAAAKIAACRAMKAEQTARRGKGYFPRSVESMRVTIRPEYHARSNPRGR